MDADLRQLTTLLMYFGGVALCFIRWPRVDRLHTVFCAATVGAPTSFRWVIGVLAVVTAAYMLFISLFKPYRRQLGLKR